MIETKGAVSVAGVLFSPICSVSPPPHFPTIIECEKEGKDEELDLQKQNSYKQTPSDCTHKSELESETGSTHHHPTPLHNSAQTTPRPTSKKASKAEVTDPRSDTGVLCNRCRPSAREKFSVVPVDNTAGRLSLASPNVIIKSLFATLVKKSPKSLSEDSQQTPKEDVEEEKWKIAVTELSHKLIHATRKRDEAVLEASRLKHSVVELEKKLNKLEGYCHSLKSSLETCTSQQQQLSQHRPIRIGDHDKVIEHFLVSVSESRSSVRHLSRSMNMQLKQVGGKILDRIAMLLQPYDIKISQSTNLKCLVLYLEALLNKTFFEDFESAGFQKGGAGHILNPIERCDTNFKSYTRLKELTWDEVLNKGTKQFSEEFSKFCDRKMSEVVAMLGWNRAWPEPLLQAFFSASKAVWMVHLLSNSVHPGLPIFRVGSGTQFDPIYMEDMGGNKARNNGPAIVRVMVEPGFYIYGNVAKCKVICRYQNNGNPSHFNDQRGLNPSPA